MLKINVLIKDLPNSQSSKILSPSQCCLLHISLLPANMNSKIIRIKKVILKVTAYNMKKKDQLK